MSTSTPTPTQTDRQRAAASRRRAQSIRAARQIGSIAGACALIGGAVWGGLWLASDVIREQQDGPNLTLEACATEDQPTDCYWDADVRGDGTGSSFIVLDGEVYTVTDRIPAHELEGF